MFSRIRCTIITTTAATHSHHVRSYGTGSGRSGSTGRRCAQTWCRARGTPWTSRTSISRDASCPPPRPTPRPSLPLRSRDPAPVQPLRVYRGTLDRRPRHSNVQHANKSPPPPPPTPPPVPSQPLLLPHHTQLPMRLLHEARDARDMKKQPKQKHESGISRPFRDASPATHDKQQKTTQATFIALQTECPSRCPQFLLRKRRV